MYIPLNIKTKSLVGLSDLTLMAPIKPGLVPSLDSITYKSRLRRVMEVLQTLRQTSHEYVPFRPISDSAERVGRIHSFRVAIVEPEDKLLLAVSFDGARESYIRVIWQKIGTLLDLLFCNTVGHVPSYGRTMAEWDAWINAVQIKTDFFYASPRLTCDDVQFLRDEEQLRRSSCDDAANDLASVRRTEPTAEIRAWTLANTPEVPAIAELARQGIQTVALLYRLTAWFVPHTPDGDFLQRASRDLVQEFTELVDDSSLLDSALSGASARFGDAFAWFKQPYEVRQVPPPPTQAPDDQLKHAIQGGILEPYAQVTHGALLLLAFKKGADTSGFWAAVQRRCASAQQQPTDRRTVWNVALTHDGLRAAGLTESELSAFPLEFRQGMEDRHSVLGDLWINHPDRWRRPVHPRTGKPIEMTAVHVVVQLRCGQARGMPPAERIYDLNDATHPLHREMADLIRAIDGCVDTLAAQPMVRHQQDPDDPASPAVEHFGYVDGDSQPELDPAKLGKVYRENLAQPGEFIIGLANAADAAEGAGQISDWLRHGSFLVLRKLSQDVSRFRDILEQGAAQTGLSIDSLAGKLAGRTRDGDPLAAPGADNDFNYEHDPKGIRCPFHAHIRRANPRLLAGAERQQPSDPVGLPELQPGARPPRIMRRSMSFGERLVDGAMAATEPPVARGIYFMAYNARIAEQFEVVQRWLAGGNSTGGFSGRSDPLIGIAPAGEQRNFMFEQADGSGAPRVHRVKLDGNALSTVLPDPLVRLEWGMYLFAPSLAALRALEARAIEVVRSSAPVEWPWSADRGRAAIDRLLALDLGERDRVDAWKSALEDPEALKDYSAASIWAAVRRDFDGILRTPYGVLAASHAHATAVLSNPDGRYSVSGYRERAAPTLGDMYLGLDDVGEGCPYRVRSTSANEAIRSFLIEQQAFEQARELTARALGSLIRTEQDNARAAGDPIWRLQFGADEVWDEVLEGLCQRWFGLPTRDARIEPGHFSWAWQPGQPVPYPGHFLSPSRYIFQPQPGSEVARIGSLHGTAVHTAFCAWVAALRNTGRVPSTPEGTPAVLSKAFFDACPRTGQTPREWAIQDERLAVVLLGALIGFLPTVEGNLRQSLNEWLLDGTFWSLRAACQNLGKAEAYQLVRSSLQRSMMLRPSPEVVWRRATCDHPLGPVTVRTGETVVAAIVSATHEQLEKGEVDEGMVFGGWRAEWQKGEAVPTHMCPGHSPAMGTLMGVILGLLECQEALRPTAFGLVFSIQGELRPAPAAERSLRGAGGMRIIERKKEAPAAPKAVKLSLLAGGDSWYSFHKITIPSGLSDLADQLQKQSSWGIQVLDMAWPTTQLAAFARDRIDPLLNAYAQMVADGNPPAAILISAGGNDVAGDALRLCVKDVSTLGLSPQEITTLIANDGAIDDDALKQLMDGPNGLMRSLVTTILDKLKAQCVRPDGSFVPVIWQGYDYPIADGRTLGSPPSGSSLWRPLTDLGYSDIADRVSIMKKVVDRYNEMLKGLSTGAAGDYAMQLRHADLRGTLIGTLADDAYKTDWHNEMHATPSGFAKLARKLYVDCLAGLAA